jgi:hypothetical protein
MVKTHTPWVTGPSSNPKNGGAWRDILATWKGEALYVGEAQSQDADHIVHCVNTHDDLIASLIELEQALGRMCTAGDLAKLERARAVIAKAKI